MLLSSLSSTVRLIFGGMSFSNWRTACLTSGKVTVIRDGAASFLNLLKIMRKTPFLAARFNIYNAFNSSLFNPENFNQL
ncbi:hypothetical protein D3C71_1149140 [compost metagenome]